MVALKWEVEECFDVVALKVYVGGNVFVRSTLCVFLGIAADVNAAGG